MPAGRVEPLRRRRHQPSGPATRAGSGDSFAVAGPTGRAAQHLTDEESPYAVVARLREALAPGSYPVLSHITGDGARGADDIISIMRQRMADPPTLRSRAEVLRLFDGFELLDPGVVPVHLWRPEGYDPQQPQRRKPRDEDEPFWMYAGVGRKP